MQEDIPVVATAIDQRPMERIGLGVNEWKNIAWRRKLDCGEVQNCHVACDYCSNDRDCVNNKGPSKVPPGGSLPNLFDSRSNPFLGLFVVPGGGEPQMEETGQNHAAHRNCGTSEQIHYRIEIGNSYCDE